DRLHEVAHRLHGLAKLVVTLSVKPRVAGDLAMRFAMIIHTPQIIAAGHRRERAIKRENFQAMTRKVEITNDLRPQQRDNVGTDGEFESRKDFFRNRSSAQDMPALEHEHFSARAREICGMRET